MRAIGYWDHEETWYNQVEERPLPNGTPAEISGMVVLDDRLYILADLSLGCGSDIQLFVYDGTWLASPGLPPEEALKAHGLGRLQGELLVFGRVSGAPAVFARNGRSWYRFPDLPVEPCTRPRFQTLADGRLYALTNEYGFYLDDDYLDQPRRDHTIHRYDSTHWTTLKTATGGRAGSLVMYSGHLYACFVSLDPTAPLHSVERWNGQEWQPVGLQLSWSENDGLGHTTSLVVHEGQLLAAGSFDRIGEFESTGLVAWDGSNWLPVPTPFESVQGALLSSIHGSLWVAGSLKTGRHTTRALVRHDGPVVADGPLRLPAPPGNPEPMELEPEPYPEFVNGTFSEWTDGLPVGWKRSYKRGWNRAVGVDSSLVGLVQPLERAGVLLTYPPGGERSSSALSQWFRVESDTFVRARLVARLLPAEEPPSEPLVRFTFSIGKAYSSVVFTDHELRTYDLLISTGDATYGRTSVRTWMPGSTLEIHELSIAAGDFGFADAFTQFEDALRGRYVGFDRAPVDVDSLLAHYRPIAARAVNRRAFRNIVKLVLEELEDERIALRESTGDSGRCTEMRTGDIRRPHSDPDRRPRRLENILFADGRGFRVGEIEPGLVYLRSEMPARFGDPDLAEVRSQLTAAKAIMVDLRDVGWRQICDYATLRQRRGETSVGRFTSVPLQYGTERARQDPEEPLILLPRDPGLSAIPVVVLVDQHTCNGGALLAMMFDALPQAELVGTPTSGTSGLPDPIPLGMGMEVFLPSVDHLDLEGRVIDDDSGVVPDLTVTDEPGRDMIFESAMALLREKLGK